MLKIDNSLLQEVGLGDLPSAEKNSFLKHIYETLEMRVGIRLADQMSNQQLDEFERYFEAKDDAGAFKWLETNFPNYKDIVQQEFDKLKAEVAQSAPQILAASQQQGQNQVQQSQASQVSPASAPAPSQTQPHPAAMPQAPQPSAQLQPAQGSTPQSPDPYQTPQQPSAAQPQFSSAPQQTQPQPTPYQTQPQQSPFPTQQPPAGPAPS